MLENPSFSSVREFCKGFGGFSRARAVKVDSFLDLGTGLVLCSEGWTCRDKGCVARRLAA